MCQVLRKQACPKLDLIYSKGFQKLRGFLRIVNSRFF